MELLEKIKDRIDEKIGEEITVLDFRNQNPFYDYAVICSARNEAHASSIVDDLEDKLSGDHEIQLIDRHKDSQWYLIQIDEVLVHVFWGAARDYYALEELWKDLLCKEN